LDIFSDKAAGMIIKDVAEFRAAHKHKKCFMIGTGPSLTYSMLDKLIPHYTFAMNNISVVYPHTEWRPTYYVNVAHSTRRYEHWTSCARESLGAASHSFLWAKNLGIVMEMAHSDVNLSLLSCHKCPQWEWNADHAVSRWGTSMFSALQLAIFMGFHPIYLVGCDLGYSTNFNSDTLQDSFHFSNDYLGDEKKRWIAENRKTLFIDEANTYVAHMLTQLAIAGMGRIIKTCSLALSHIYPYISFEDALNE